MPDELTKEQLADEPCPHLHAVVPTRWYECPTCRGGAYDKQADDAAASARAAGIEPR